jgi:hypothetical protein
MIDRSPAYSGAIARGTLERFAAAPQASFTEVSATPAGFPNRVYRRAITLVEAPGGNVYVLDIFRMAGGNVRTYCFHGPPFDAFDTSQPLTPTGDEHFEVGPIGRNLDNNLLRPAAVATGEDFWADWKRKDDDLRLRVAWLGEPSRRYIGADCGKTDIPPVKFLFAEDEGEDDTSEFVSVWQPYVDQPFIERIERLPVQGATDGEFQPVAVRVHLISGRVDTFIYTMQPNVPLQVGDLQFQGAFGYFSQQGDKMVAAHLAGGGYLHRDGEGITDMPAPTHTTITAVDYDHRTITLAEPLPVDSGLLQIGDQHRTAYHAIGVDGNVVTLRYNAIIYQSRLDDVIEDGRTAVCELPLSIEASRGFPPGYYDGATLTNERGDVHYRIVGVDDNHIQLDRSLDRAAFTDADGDGRVLVKVYDFGPGDAVTLQHSMFVSK